MYYPVRQGLIPNWTDRFTPTFTHGLQVDPKDPGDNVFLIVNRVSAINTNIIFPMDLRLLTMLDHRYRRNLPVCIGIILIFMAALLIKAGRAYPAQSSLKVILIRCPEVKAAAERLLVLNELWVDNDGTVPTALVVPNAGWSPFTALLAVSTNMVFTVNGQYHPTMTIKENETHRWRVLAAGPHRFFHLEVENHDLYQIAQDGIPFQTKTSELISMAPESC